MKKGIHLKTCSAVTFITKSICRNYDRKCTASQMTSVVSCMPVRLWNIQGHSFVIKGYIMVYTGRETGKWAGAGRTELPKTFKTKIT